MLKAAEHPRREGPERFRAPGSQFNPDALRREAVMSHLPSWFCASPERSSLRRYCHPGEQHRMEAVQKLAIANAAREIAEAEKKKELESVPTPAENQPIFESSETAGKPQQIN